MAEEKTGATTTQQDDIPPNDTRYIGLTCDTQQKRQVHLCVSFFIVMLNAVSQNVIMPSVVAPKNDLFGHFFEKKKFFLVKVKTPKHSNCFLKRNGQL